MDKNKQQQAIDRAHGCAKHWPFLNKLQLLPTSECMSSRLTRLNNEGCPMSDRAAFQIADHDIMRLANACTTFFDQNHMSSWQRYRADYYVSFRANWSGIAGDDLQMLLTWFDPPNCDDVPYGLGYGLDTAARVFINTQMSLMLDLFGYEQQLAVVLQLLRGCHLVAWQTIKWELQRATGRHRECECECCSRRNCFDPLDESFADLSCIAMGSSIRLERKVSRGSWMQRFKAALAKPRL